MNDNLCYPSLFDLIIDVISTFKPSQLQVSSRRVGAMSTEKPLESQYQDEFYYRSLLAVTSGNVRLTPEFASARRAPAAGHIDFFIPIAKWGTELTRDGSKLVEHSSRFSKSGAYGAWLTSGVRQSRM